jgi:ubiquinone/menaquinone biosynthesis C-methylase UbiE
MVCRHYTSRIGRIGCCNFGNNLPCQNGNHTIGTKHFFLISDTSNLRRRHVMSEQPTKYILGSSDQEIERLDRQAASIEGATRLLLRASGIQPGMRVLDLGTGIGHVAMLIAEQVGPVGRVIGIDNNTKLLDVAALRTMGRPQLRFIEGDVCSWRDDEPFDAIVGRLILFHLADPVRVLRHHVASLRAGGLLLALDFDLGAARAEPELPLITEVLGWVNSAFRYAGASPAIGAKLALLMTEAGFADVQGFGVQGYFAPYDPRGPMLLSSVVRTLASQIAAAGLATPEQIDIDTLEARIASAVKSSGAAILPPTLAGAWGRRC